MSTVSVTNLKHESASGNNITLDSSGRVGIGTSSPTQKLFVESAGANYIVTRDSTSGGIAGIICQNGSDTRGIRINNANLELYDHSAALARVIVDSSGRVTMPYQPAFHAVSTSVKTITGSAFIFDSAYFNIGGHYNTSNGRFTAPVSGIYFLEMSFLTSNTNTNNVDLRFFKNGTQTQIATTYHVNYTGGNHRKGHMIGMASLTANDYITVQTQSSSSNGDLYGDNNEGGGKGHTCFRGYLIG